MNCLARVEFNIDQPHGWIEIKRAWAARGSGWANTVTEDGWRGFREHLTKAEALLDVSLLRSKAADLRVTAADIATPLSTTYRRRAAELELEAAALAARFGLIEDLTLAA